MIETHGAEWNGMRALEGDERCLITGAISGNSVQQHVCDGCIFMVERAECVQW